MKTIINKIAKGIDFNLSENWHGECNNQHTNDDEMIYVGWVHIFDYLRGFGFIADLINNEEYYFHVSSIGEDFGYKCGSLQRAMYNNPRLFAYIEETFNDAKAVKICADTSESLIRSGQSFGYGGEGDAHKELKEYIFNNPHVIDIKEYTKKEKEHILLSADRIDVWFEALDGSGIAVEVKSSKSSDADVMRGLYQCVKYKSIMDAEDTVHGEKHTNRSILVLGGALSEENRYVRDILGITVIENVENKIR